MVAETFCTPSPRPNSLCVCVCQNSLGTPINGWFPLGLPSTPRRGSPAKDTPAVSRTLKNGGGPLFVLSFNTISAGCRVQAPIFQRPKTSPLWRISGQTGRPLLNSPGSFRMAFGIVMWLCTDLRSKSDAGKMGEGNLLAVICSRNACFEQQERHTQMCALFFGQDTFGCPHKVAIESSQHAGDLVSPPTNVVHFRAD